MIQKGKLHTKIANNWSWTFGKKDRFQLCIFVQMKYIIYTVATENLNTSLLGGISFSNYTCVSYHTIM